MLTGFNHLTLAVTDLDRSFAFYVDLLGLKPHARWAGGAYLSVPGLWLCLSLDPARAQTVSRDYTHYAFSVGDIDTFAARLRAAGVPEWKDNRSEGASIYFLDPDSHRLEAHVGDLESRLAACRARPYPDMTLF